MLTMHPIQRFLTQEDGDLFFYTGDNAGELFPRLSRDSDNGPATYILAYRPVPQRMTIDTHMRSEARITANWYDPPTGQSRPIGTFTNSGTFQAPAAATQQDGLLTLDQMA